MASPWPISPDLGFLRDVWIRTPLVAVASRRFLLSYRPPLAATPPPPPTTPSRHFALTDFVDMDLNFQTI